MAKESDTTKQLNYQQPTKASTERSLPAPPEMYKEQRPPGPRLHQNECALRNTKVSDFAPNSDLLFLHGGREGRKGGERNMKLDEEEGKPVMVRFSHEQINKLSLLQLQFSQETNTHLFNLQEDQ